MDSGGWVLAVNDGLESMIKGELGTEGYGSEHY
jgi:hypothetical protein